MNMIKIRVVLSGLFSERHQVEELVIDTTDNIHDAIGNIEQIVAIKKGEKIPYVLLVNGINYSIKSKRKDLRLKDGDILTIIPIVSGG